MSGRYGKNGWAEPPGDKPITFTPNPRERSVPLKAGWVAGHRNLSCVRYGRCLDKAAMGRWISFSCRDCPGFGERPLDTEPVPVREDHHPLDEHKAPKGEGKPEDG